MSDEDKMPQVQIIDLNSMEAQEVSFLADRVQIFGVRFNEDPTEFFGFALGSGNLILRFGTTKQAFINWLRSTADHLETTPYSKEYPRNEDFCGGCDAFLTTAMKASTTIHDVRDQKKKPN